MAIRRVCPSLVAKNTGTSQMIERFLVAMPFTRAIRVPRGVTTAAMVLPEFEAQSAASGKSLARRAENYPAVATTGTGAGRNDRPIVRNDKPAITHSTPATQNAT